MPRVTARELKITARLQALAEEYGSADDVRRLAKRLPPEPILRPKRGASDDAALKVMARLQVQNPKLSVRAAARVLVCINPGYSAKATVDRLRRKYMKDRALLLAEARCEQAKLQPVQQLGQELILGLLPILPAYRRFEVALASLIVTTARAFSAGANRRVGTVYGANRCEKSQASEQK